MNLANHRAALNNDTRSIEVSFTNFTEHFTDSYVRKIANVDICNNSFYQIIYHSDMFLFKKTVIFKLYFSHFLFFFCELDLFRSSWTVSWSFLEWP